MTKTASESTQPITKEQTPTTFKESFKFSQNLLKSTFKRDSPYKNEIDKLKHILNTKAWIFHILSISSRVLYAVLGISSWQIAYKEKDSIENLNTEFVDKSQSIIKAGIILLLILEIQVNILIWRKRRYAFLLLYFNMFHLLWVGFVPYDYGDLQSFTALVTYIGSYFAYACDFPPQIVVTSISYLILQLFQIPLVYNEELTFAVIAGKVWNAFTVFIVCTVVISMVVTYIAQLKGKMSKLMKENLNLLNKMNEGLIVVSEKDRSLQFASNPAVRLLKQLPQAFESLDNEITSQIQIIQDDLNAPLFDLKKVSITGNDHWGSNI